MYKFSETNLVKSELFFKRLRSFLYILRKNDVSATSQPDFAHPLRFLFQNRGTKSTDGKETPDKEEKVMKTATCKTPFLKLRAKKQTVPKLFYY